MPLGSQKKKDACVVTFKNGHLLTCFGRIERSGPSPWHEQPLKVPTYLVLLLKQTKDEGRRSEIFAVGCVKEGTEGTGSACITSHTLRIMPAHEIRWLRFAVFSALVCVFTGIISRRIRIRVHRFNVLKPLCVVFCALFSVIFGPSYLQRFIVSGTINVATGTFLLLRRVLLPFVNVGPSPDIVQSSVVRPPPTIYVNDKKKLPSGTYPSWKTN